MNRLDIWIRLRHSVTCLRYWWSEKFLWWVAFRLPRRLALLAFVRVYGVLNRAGQDYDEAYTRFSRGEGR